MRHGVLFLAITSQYRSEFRDAYRRLIYIFSLLPYLFLIQLDKIGVNFKYFMQYDCFSA